MNEIRPTMLKTLVKGIVAILVFSLFLEVKPSNIVNYLIFVLVSLGLVCAYAGFKHMSRYQIVDDGIVVKSFPHAERKIGYDQILDVTVSQGVLAKRFGCGTVFVILSKGKGGYSLMGGGMAEALKDVSDPQGVMTQIVQRLSPYVS